MKPKLKKYQDVSLDVLFGGSRDGSADMNPIVNHYLECLPDWRPERWGVTEPYRKEFTRVEDMKLKQFNAPSDKWDFGWRKS
jgi:hypothetical protein